VSGLGQSARGAQLLSSARQVPMQLDRPACCSKGRSARTTQLLQQGPLSCSSKGRSACFGSDGMCGLASHPPFKASLAAVFGVQPQPSNQQSQAHCLILLPRGVLAPIKLSHHTPSRGCYLGAFWLPSDSCIHTP